MSKQVEKNKVTTEQLGKALIPESESVKLITANGGWILTGKSITEYRALRALLLKGDK